MQKNIMQKKAILICALLVAAMFQLILTSATAQAAAPNACKAIDDAYRKQITSGMHLKITRTSSGEMSGRNGMIYGADDTGIALTNVGPTPIKARKAEDFLTGKPLDDANIKQAAALAASEAQPSSDLRGPAEYKEAMVKELTKRALTRARQRAGQ